MTAIKETRTADSVIEWFKEAVASRKPINPELWMDAAAALNIFRLDEELRLNDMKRKLAEKKVAILDGMEKRNVSEAELRIEATAEYEDMKDQQSKCEILKEFVLLAKKYADQDKF